MTETLHGSTPRGADPFSATWVLTVPWAHPLWDQYLIVIFDLTTPVVGMDTILHLKEATHEIQVWALDPKSRVTELSPDVALGELRRLHPLNHGYQFIAESDEAAMERGQKIVEAIEKGQLSPDTDFIAMWDKMFADGASMRKT